MLLHRRIIFYIFGEIIINKEKVMQLKNFDRYGSFPKQKVASSKKTSKWAARCVNWGAERNVLEYSPVRNSVRHQQINYDLLNGKLHMDDLKMIVNPYNMTASFVPEKIQHYPIMNAKLRVLHGEESKRVFDYSVVVTNPTAISEMQEAKKAELMQKMQELIANNSLSEQDFQQKSAELEYYSNYTYKDFREIRANALLSHYSMQENFTHIFNQGFMDAMAVGEEIYQVGVTQGEPFIQRLNPRKVRIYQSGFSNRIEDADMIVIEDYWNPGRIIDTYHDVLSDKDIDYIENFFAKKSAIPTDTDDDTAGFVRLSETTDPNKATIEQLFGQEDAEFENVMPYDFYGNIRVCQVYWKTYRKIQKVKYYDPETGEESFTLHTEEYIPNKDRGEESTPYWINEAYQGVKIGDKLYVNMGPCPIQFNTINNPSKCHFGIIGSIYNLNDDKPFSMVDIMKPYNYMYDVAYDGLLKLLARNHGKIIKLDFAKIPEKWGIEKWLTILKTAGVAVEDSFKEGNKGVATGKLAGSLNNASSGVVDAEMSQSILAQIQFLEFIKNEMSEVAGISKQREGQISNRETVGGVERATLQSSHITEWLFITHDDLKKRAIEAFIEVSKAAARGRTLKFQYLLPDSSFRLMEVDGDEYAECDYGIVVNNSNEAQELKANLPSLVQAGLSSKMTTFSSAMKIWSAHSLAEKQRMIENDERMMQQQAQQAQQQQMQEAQATREQEMQLESLRMQHEAEMNERDNETKILIATIQANAKQNEALETPQDNSMSEGERAKLDEQIREFDANLAFLKDKQREDTRLKEKQINKKQTTTKS